MLHARCVVGVTARRHFHHGIGRAAAVSPVSAASSSTTSLATISNDSRGRVDRLGITEQGLSWQCRRARRTMSHGSARDDIVTGPIVSATPTTTTSTTTLDPAATNAADTALTMRDDDDDDDDDDDEIDIPLHVIEAFEKAGGRVQWSTVIDEETGQSRPYYHLHSVAGDAADQIIVEWACTLDDPAEKEAWTGTRK